MCIRDRCETCQTNLNFVLQVYKNKESEEFFPKQTNLFQVFRCPNKKCNDSYNDNHDLQTKLYFFKDNMKGIQIQKPKILINENYESEVPLCEIRPILKDDLPQYDDHNSDIISNLEEIYGDDGSEYFIESYQPIVGTKICLLYTSPSPRDLSTSRMPSSA